MMWLLRVRISQFVSRSKCVCCVPVASTLSPLSASCSLTTQPFYFTALLQLLFYLRLVTRTMPAGSGCGRNYVTPKDVAILPQNLRLQHPFSHHSAAPLPTLAVDNTGHGEACRVDRGMAGLLAACTSAATLPPVVGRRPTALCRGRGTESCPGGGRTEVTTGSLVGGSWPAVARRERRRKAQSTRASRTYLFGAWGETRAGAGGSGGAGGIGGASSAGRDGGRRDSGRAA